MTYAFFNGTLHRQNDTILEFPIEWQRQLLLHDIEQLKQTSAFMGKCNRAGTHDLKITDWSLGLKGFEIAGEQRKQDGMSLLGERRSSLTLDPAGRSALLRRKPARSAMLGCPF